MTVRDLIKILQQINPDALVVMESDYGDITNYYAANSVEKDIKYTGDSKQFYHTQFKHGTPVEVIWLE
jgi:hypothetical protein